MDKDQAKKKREFFLRAQTQKPQSLNDLFYCAGPVSACISQPESVMLTMLWSPWGLQLWMSSDVDAIFSGVCSPLQSLMWQQHHRALLCEYVGEHQYSKLEQMVQ